MTTQPYTESWIVGPQSTNFYTRTYVPPALQPPKAVIVFVHGFAEHIGRYIHFHPLLAARGIAVFAFDQRGYGLTAQDTSGKKSKPSSYGRTSWKEQMEDIAWAIGHAKKEFEGVPLFLMGHSMGGAEALGFAVQGPKDPQVSSVQYITGLISTSPFIAQTHPAPKIAKWIGGKLSNFAPGVLIPAAVKGEHLSHDPEVFKAYEADPLIKMSGSLRAVNDMLTKGDWLSSIGHTQWPKGLPVIIIHGDEDQVTLQKASKAFFDALPEGTVKTYSLYEGGYHELQNELEDTRKRLENEIVAFVEAHLGASTKTSPAEVAAPFAPAAKAASIKEPEATNAEAVGPSEGSAFSVAPAEDAATKSKM